jgi:hypothetical protein
VIYVSYIEYMGIGLHVAVSFDVWVQSHQLQLLAHLETGIEHLQGLSVTM